MNTLGLYLHVPFCKRKCPYCDFYSLSDLSVIDKYLDALISAIRFYGDKKRVVDTIYFGGGTPSLLSPAQIGAILKASGQEFDLHSPEITLEANPCSVNESYLAQIRGVGVNRLSLGVQSLNNNELKALGRLHDADSAKAAIKSAQRAGFKNISADLMVGVSNQTESSLSHSIEELAELSVDHISSYLLKIEEGTPYFDVMDTLKLPDDDEMAKRYLSTVEKLESLGYKQYEISNFSKPDFESRHNLKYWRLEDYLGLGPAAHSFYKGKRFYFDRDLGAFLEMAEQCAFAPTPDVEVNLKEEYIMLALRLSEGLSLKHAADLGINTDELLNHAKAFIDSGYMIFDGERLAFTPKGFLVSNSIISRLI